VLILNSVSSKVEKEDKATDPEMPVIEPAGTG
jgi:hypothetical protein